MNWTALLYTMVSDGGVSVTDDSISVLVGFSIALLDETMLEMMIVDVLRLAVEAYGAAMLVVSTLMLLE
ncbi:hypothetical protein [Corallococcus sicarius]|uniref:hypothetical protein n=1 Tax=Corallococcus sicarius TaxID=2316726 RepID=UPI0011C3592E|nr:hypothetical protein [Corallococcus sicarius]